MFVRDLTLQDFRSWDNVHLELGPEPTVFVGRNGFGKTNLLEALYYLTTLQSHRVSSDGPLIRSGCESAKISATVQNSGRELNIELVLAQARANHAAVNGSVRKRPRDILGVLRSVMFAPEDLALVRGDPSDRRRFLDELVATNGPRLAAARSDYDRVLRQRAALLKTAAAAMRRRKADADTVISTLDVWDDQLAEHGAVVTAARLSAVAQLRPYMARAYASIAPSSRAATVRYRSSIDDRLGDLDRPADPAAIADMMLTRLRDVRDKEINRGVCLIGPHRDDMDVILGADIAKSFASHGESWSLALSMRLGSVELLRETGTEPVLMLDDVFAELDAARREKLVAFVETAEQLLITAAVPDDIPPAIRGRRITIGVVEAEGYSRTSFVTDPSQQPE